MGIVSGTILSLARDSLTLIFLPLQTILFSMPIYTVHFLQRTTLVSSVPPSLLCEEKTAAYYGMIRLQGLLIHRSVPMMGVFTQLSRLILPAVLLILSITCTALLRHV